MSQCVIFHCPENMHILKGCPFDLVRFECICDTPVQALIKISKLQNAYAPRNPSGYPASVYHYCSVSQWEHFLSQSLQLSLFD